MDFIGFDLGKVFSQVCEGEAPNARHHPRLYSSFMRGSVAGRRVHAVVRQRYATELYI